MAQIRLSKILAQSGLTSRRGGEALLAQGRVTVNGRVRLEPGAQADPGVDVIAVDGRALPAVEPKTYLLLHKPRGYLSSAGDPGGRPVVLDLVRGRGPRLFPVGRLDYDAEGLLLLTNDGALAHRLLHPRYEIPRVYEAEVEGRVRPADLGRWRRGVTLSDGPAVPAAVTILGAGPRGTRLRLTFGEGRNREVKRYCQALGHPVHRLVRVAFGPLRLGRLRVGESRPLTAAELGALRGLRGPDSSPTMQGLPTEASQELL
ncbi:MAG: rRNA pseudouridine synthase [Candidatus Rokubacteria bacterium]|nr:rRNA pseudouridine synthase [Candidatus Rokubacteria bacterium]